MPKTRSGKQYASIMTSSTTPNASKPDPPKPHVLRTTEAMLQIGLFLKAQLEQDKRVVVDEINIHLPVK